jgi:hypothetical protein
MDIHVILDNYATHNHPVIKAWLAKHPRVQFHFTPTSASWLKCPLDECAGHDVKGLYRKALAGEIADFSEVSDPYEPPLAPEVMVETDREGPAESLAKIRDALRAGGYVAPGGHRERAPIRSWIASAAGASSAARRSRPTPCGR